MNTHPQQSDLKSLLPIDWQALTLLGKEINRIQGNQYDERDIAVIAAPDEPKEFVVMVASVIASSRNERFVERIPTEEDIKRLKPWVDSIQKLIRRISPAWADRFGSYVERTGQNAVYDAASLIVSAAEWSRRFKEPRKQFVEQMAKLYLVVAHQSSALAVEQKIESLFHALRWGENEGLPGFNAREFPLLFSAARRFDFPSENFSASEAGIAGAEFMTGIYEFLSMQGVRGLPRPPAASEFDIFDMSTWMRGIAEMFFAEKLELVRSRLPELLNLVVRVLPESGPELADAMYKVAERMCELDAEGMSADDICRTLFK